MQEENILERIAQNSIASIPGNSICRQPVPSHANSHNHRIIRAPKLTVKPNGNVHSSTFRLYSTHQKQESTSDSSPWFKNGSVSAFANCKQIVFTQKENQHEYRLMVFPIVLGSGKRVFRDGSEKKILKLVETKTFASGVVVLSYEPVAKGDEK